MKQDIGRNNIRFHDRAQEVSHTLFREFTHKVVTLDRQRDEHVFQQLGSQYTDQLRRQLERLALELLSGVERSDERQQWNGALSRYIQDYVKDFTQKIQSL